MHNQQISEVNPFEQVTQVQVIDYQRVKREVSQCLAILSSLSPVSSQLSHCQKLMSQHHTLPQILPILFSLLQQYSQKNQILCKLIITQIFTYLKKQSTSGFQIKHDKMQIAMGWVNFFMQAKVQLKFKKMCEQSFMQFIYADQCFKLREYLVKHVFMEFTKIYSQSMDTFMALKQYNKITLPISIFLPTPDILTPDNLAKLSSLIHILKALFQGGTLEYQLMKTILPNCFSIYFMMTMYYVRKIEDTIKNKQQAEFISQVQDCTRFTEMLVFLFGRLDTGKYPAIRDRVLQTRQVLILPLFLLTLSPQFQGTQLISRFFASFCYSSQRRQSGLQELSFYLQRLKIQQTLFYRDQFFEKSNPKTFINLLLIKKYSFEILIKCVKALSRKSQKRFSFIKEIVQAVFPILKNALIITTQKFLKQSQESQTVKAHHQQLLDIFSCGIKLLAVSVTVSQLHNFVFKFRDQIFFKLCFPWLITRRSHQKLSAQDYNYFREDIISKNSLNYIQNSIGQLCQAYLDNIDGSISSITSNCTNLISYQLTNDVQYSSILSIEMKQSWVVGYYSIERQIQGALALLAIQSYLSTGRNDIVLAIEHWLYQHRHFFFNVNNDYRITTQLLILYSYYADDFYQNLLTGKTTLNAHQSRFLHKKLLEFCCLVMQQNYDYQLNKYKGKTSQILFLQSLDCINNSFNHIQLIPALYINYPPREEIQIPHSIGQYVNYPFYPPKISKQQSQLISFNKNGNISSFDRVNQSRQEDNDDLPEKMRLINVHFRKLGLNRSQHCDKDSIQKLFRFLSSHLQTKANIKILQLLSEFFLQFIKTQIKNQGGLINIPTILRNQISIQIGLKLYSLMNPTQKFPNRGLFKTKSNQLLYIVHTIVQDPYYLYMMGMDTIWNNQLSWQLRQEEFDVEKLSKCTDLVVRLALKHYHSLNNVDVLALLTTIADHITHNGFTYLRRVKKFNILFGILLNLILLKIRPQKIFDFIFILITQHLFKIQLNDGTQQNINEQNDNKHIIKFDHDSISALIQQSFYLFLLNIYRNCEYLNTQKSFKLLEFTNVQNIVVQLGDIFGKVLACCLCLLQKQFLLLSSSSFPKQILQFLFQNILYSSKLYKTELQKKIVSIKLLSLLKQSFSLNNQSLGLGNLQLMYQIASSCLYLVKNKDTLMDDQEGGFDHQGEEEEWELPSITIRINQTNSYIQNQVLILKNLTRQLLQTNRQVKQWLTKIIQNLPIAVKNFVKNKVLYYQSDAPQIGLRKIVKVKRLTDMNDIDQTNKKKDILAANIIKRQQEQNQSDNDD